MLPDGPTQPDHPVTLVDWASAVAFCRWEAARTGLGWRLPDELEWEKAARGVDGRPFVWGDQPEAGWANVLSGTSDTPRPSPVGAWPTDVSPYGVFGLAGNTRDWCGNVWEAGGPPCPGGALQIVPAAADDERFRAVRGGAW
ncbi:MAG: SUMF1/EgtB/PvdO family nonheme iron enzyme, partial [Myxococcales bacterium]|nr:SUMF1/EgtB/PvdO family nonheme iron enzyme [Myxococcales bacterium]